MAGWERLGEAALLRAVQDAFDFPDGVFVLDGEVEGDDELAWFFVRVRVSVLLELQLFFAEGFFQGGESGQILDGVCECDGDSVQFLRLCSHETS